MKSTTFSHRRTVLLALASTALLIPAVRAGVVSAQQGDLILGFRATGGTGAGANIEVDLGSVSNFYNGASSTLILSNLVTRDLVDTYGANWGTRTDLFWGAAATDGNAQVDPNGKPASTLWATGVPGNAAPVEGSTGLQSPAATKIGGMYQGSLGSLDGSTSTTNSSTAAAIQNTQAGSWSVQETSGNSFGFFNPKIDGQVSNVGTLNLYELQPTTTFPRPAGALLGSLILTQNGLSFHAGGNTNSVTPPVVSFSATPTSGSAPLTVAFTDTSSNSPTSWAWTFGDAGTSTSQNPSHTYTVPGTYTVTLIATSAGGSSTNVQANLIAALTPPPVASFNALPTSGAAPLPVTFTDTTAGSITNLAWNFGDGGTSSASSPVHTYTNAGVFSVSLVVIGPGGASTNVQAGLITITSTNIPPDTTPPALTIVIPSHYQTVTNSGLLVAGTASDVSGIKGVAVNGAPANVLGTNWFTHITLVQGTNAIAVIATDNSPAMNTTTQVVFAVLSSSLPGTNRAPVIVSAPAVTNAMMEVTNANDFVVVAGDTNVFNVRATDPSGYPLNYAWTFGDGASTAPSPTSIATHVYTNCGPYNASVTVSDGIDSTNAGLTVSVPCAMNISGLKLQARFKKLGSDACTIKGTLAGLPPGFSIANAAVSLDAGGATVDIQLNKKGSGANRNGNIKFSYNKKTGVWKFTGKLKGDLKGSWATYGITSGTVIDSGVPAFPVLLTLQSGTLETFDVELPLSYSNKSGTSGTATLRLPPVTAREQF